MGNTPELFDRKALSRAGVVGAALGTLGVMLFIGIWIILSGIDPFPRLMVSLCVPPGVLAAIVGAYFLSARPNR